MGERLRFDEIEYIKRRYYENAQYIEIANELGRPSATIRYHVMNMQAFGILKEREKPKRKSQNVEILRQTIIRPKTPAQKEQPYTGPLSGDGWVRCTDKIAVTCVYGCHSYNRTSGKCNYILVEGHMRGCPWEYCTKYQKIDKDHPRLYKDIFAEEFNPSKKG